MADTRNQIEANVAHVVTEHALWPRDATVVAAVSGGADSLCLLGALLALRDGSHPLAPGCLVVAHLDHGLRGEAGAADARWVVAFAAERGLDCIVERADVHALARAEHRGIEDAARRARYAFLRRVAHDTGAVRICTGHTRDDQAETLVLHWLRGSGLAGLSGMPPLSGDIARPLLDLTHADTLAYCAARGWQPREDATNADTTYLRNRVRRELLPVLEQYNPNLRDTLIRNAALMSADERYLEELTDAAWSTVVNRVETNRISLSLPALANQPLALRHRIYRRMECALLEDAGGRPPDAPTTSTGGRPADAPTEARHILAVERLVSAGTSGEGVALPGGLRIRREYILLICERLPAHPSPGRIEAGREVPLPVPGALDLPALGWRLRARLIPGPLDAATLRKPQSPVVDPATGASLPYPRAYLDADAAGNALLVRTWRRGDRIQPLGMGQEKKLQDLFTDAKIPRSLRTRLPLVVGGSSPSSPLWVAGLRSDERVRVRETTTRVLVLDLEPLVS